MSTPESRCWSCRGTGTGTWCQLCKPAPEPVEERDPVFGAPQEPGRLGTWMQTWTGDKCWPRSPRVTDIRIEDIAIGLARECRYGKMTIRWYSVAEHSVLVSILAGEFVRSTQPNRPELALAVEREGLFHDGDEAPLHDMPRPIKHDPGMHLEHYRALGVQYRNVVFERFGIKPTAETHAIIDSIDKRLVVDEVEQFMRTPSMYLERHGHIDRIGCTIPGYGPEQATELFLSRFAELFPEELTS
jgi:hypothetical protein